MPTNSTSSTFKAKSRWGTRRLDEDVYQLALDRTRRAFDTFDHCFVAFSGGKDSTVVLNVALVVAEERCELPLRVVHWDEEAIPYQTEDYVRRVARDPRVALEWLCLPVQHRNACSKDHPFWWPWAPESRDLWVRPLPPEAITEVEGFPVSPPAARPSVPESSGLMCPSARYGSTGMLMGIRAAESLTRNRAVRSYREENWVIPAPSQGPNLFKCQPTGTLVAVVTERGSGSTPSQWEQRPIEDVRVGDRVASYRTKRASFVENGRTVTGVYRRSFSGDLVEVSAGGRVSRYTPEHICTVRRLGAAFTGHHVYLMRRGDSYRIGRTKAWTAVGAGIKTRAKTERADAVWILSRHETAREAAEQEMYLQWAYGIPSATFESANTSASLKQEELDRFWARVGDLSYAAKAVLDAHGRDARFPLWERTSYFAGHRGLLVRATNLMDGMEFTTEDREKVAITVDRGHYEGDVVSLGVEVDETYVADGLVTHNCYPVYDWTTQDVWTAPALFGWDVNEAYDLMEMVGITHHAQRCAPPYGEEPMQKLWVFKECFPEIWDRMAYRVPGAATAARYADTELYSFGAIPDKPDDVTWQEWIRRRLEQQDPAVREAVAHRIARYIKMHYAKTTDPILEVDHPVSGLSWPWLWMLADRADLKQRRTTNLMADPTKYYEALDAYRAEETAT